MLAWLDNDERIQKLLFVINAQQSLQLVVNGVLRGRQHTQINDSRLLMLHEHDIPKIAVSRKQNSLGIVSGFS